MKSINKYKPHSPIIHTHANPLKVVLSAWFCGLCIALYFWPQIQTYFHIAIQDYQHTQIETIEVSSHSDSLKNYWKQEKPSISVNSPDTVQKIIPPVQQSRVNDPISEPIKIFKQVQASTLPTTIPKKILIIGSSSMNGALGAFLSSTLRRKNLEIVRHTKVSSGLARPDYYNWIEIIPTIIAEHQPDLVLIQFVGNDCQSLLSAEGVLEAQYGKPEWEEAYRQRIAEVFELFHKDRVRVAWIGMSNVGLPGFRQRLRRSNRILKEVATDYNSQFVSLWGVTSQRNGAVLPGVRMGNIDYPLLTNDDIHLSIEGSRMVSNEIFRQLQKRYSWK